MTSSIPRRARGAGTWVSNVTSFNDDLFLETMASGHLCLRLSTKVTWEEFPRFAEQLLAVVGGRVVNKTDAADVRIWEIAFHDRALRLVFDDYPAAVSFEAADPAGDAFLRELKQKLSAS
jgi:hypothetical protein